MLMGLGDGMPEEDAENLLAEAGPDQNIDYMGFVKNLFLNL